VFLRETIGALFDSWGDTGMDFKTQRLDVAVNKGELGPGTDNRDTTTTGGVATMFIPGETLGGGDTVGEVDGLQGFGELDKESIGVYATDEAHEGISGATIGVDGEPGIRFIAGAGEDVEASLDEEGNSFEDTEGDDD
jgi:hypothetical protein